MRPVVTHMTALAECAQVRTAIVGWIVIKMGRSQGYVCIMCNLIWKCGRFAVAVAPYSRFWIAPTSIGHAQDHVAMRPATLLTMAAGTNETDPMA